jgi:DNA repair exonuclease SbcCD nuclease subunit
MASEWAKVLSELNTKPNPGMAPTLGSLKDDHYYFMRQLHERTPEALEMEKSRQATLDTAKIFKAAIGDQTEAMKAASENAALEEMRAQMAAQERRFEERLAQMEAKPAEAATEAPAATEKPAAGKKPGR